MAYQYKPWARYKTPAEIAGRVMGDLAEKNSLNPKTLVEVSRPIDAPLHNEFEWNDSIAAEKWRMQEARVLIDAVVFVHEEIEAEPVRAFFQVEEHTNYEPIHVILQDENKTDLLLRRALGELNAFRSKYHSLKIFKKLFDDIDEIEQKIEKQ